MKKLKNIGILILFSSFLTGCVSKEEMDHLTNNWFITLHIIVLIGASSLAVRYSSSGAQKIAIMALIAIIGSILYRLGYINVY